MRGTWKPGGSVTRVVRRIKMMLALAAVCALTACGGNGDGTASTALLIGTSAINLSGGDSATTGGNGGKFSAYSSARSDLKVLATGSVDASFTVPAYSYNFGSNPVTSTDVTVLVDPGAPSAGQLYMKSGGDTNLYLGTGTPANDTAVTGLTVPANTTITFPAPVTFSNAVVISGTVQSAGQPLDLTAGSLQINAGGKVSTSGGTLTLATSSGVIINAGTIDSISVAGSAGALSVKAATFLYNTGTISAKGSGASANGGPISLFAATASLLSSGIIDASGGSGAAGGNAGAIQLVAGDTVADTALVDDTNGKVAISGTVSANGGDATDGAGGSGGTITHISHSQPLLVNAVISAVGGKASGATGTGGSGGELHLLNLLAKDPGNNLNTSPQGIKVGGAISLNGGSGGLRGGDGGTLFVRSVASPNALPGSAAVEFFGFGFGINLNGGKAKTDTGGGTGGVGGTFAATLASAVTDNVNLPAGGVYNEVAITARGGDSAATLTGGAGGTVLMQTPVPGSTANVGSTIISNSGSIDVSGGSGDTGGAAGGVAMIAYDKVTNSGAITATGGTGATQGGRGAQGLPPDVSVAGIYLHTTYGNVVNSGAIVTTGGTGLTGGMGGAIEVGAGTQIVNSGTILANGGNGVGSGTLTGGNGGSIKLFSQTLLTSNIGSLNVFKGAGTGGSPANGTLVIDGVTIAI